MGESASRNHCGAESDESDKEKDKESGMNKDLSVVEDDEEVER